MSLKFHISIGTAHIITGTDGKEYKFETPASCGLGLLNKDGSICISPEPKAFWSAIEKWERQGRVIENGVAVFI